ncbi:type I secretion C-terminal target domain-containing protein [Caenimonas koreensis]|uniref:type I secretion C-terminal target domain-containing protein n=1 Tax=Caenimonas koreensis TaxID=367474 RepID=UPI002B27311B|nr:Calx-beta domain-containing protein [Caenimonas koreensis]
MSATEATSIVHTVNLSNASSSATTFTLTLGDVTATGGGTDYTSTLTSTAFTNGVTISGGVITVPAGVTTFSVSVPTAADTIDEPNETYNLTVGGASGVGTILDDDAAPTISSVTSASATEATSIVHTVNLSNASSSATTFTLTLGDVTATGGGTDYTSALTSTAFTNGVTIAVGVITVPAGVTTFSVSVATTTDTIDEPNETYNLTVGGASGVGTILDDDAAPTVSSVTSASATEATSIVHTVNLSNPSSSVTTFALTLGGGTATGGGTDYTSTLTSTAFTNGVTIAAGVITVPAGVTTFSVSVPTAADTIDEPNETYNLTVGGASGVGTIIDDDNAPTIASVTSASATEATSIVHTVNLSNASSSATTFTLTLADVTATGGGTDYTSALTSTAFTNGVTIAAGVITVPAGVTTFSVSVATTTDTIDEPNETYNLTIGGASGVGTIIDDDAAPTISSVSSVSATEATSIVHTVNLSNPSSSATTFTLTLGDVTATGGGTDYTSTLTSTAFTNGVTISGGVITVPAGVTTFSVSVPTAADTIDEPNETYNLTIGGASGVGTIIDDDAAPTISSVTSASATEATSIVHTVSLSNASSSATTFTLTLADVTATGGGTDYTSALTSTAFTNGVTIAAGVITVPAGVTTFSVSVPTTTDTIDEPNETYNLTVGGASGVGTIIDDDAAPTISSVSSVSATEATSIVHTVNLSNPSSSVTTFALTLGGGTATGGGTDYTSTLTSTAFTNGVTISGGVITVPAGVTTFSVSVPTAADTIDEPNETYNLTIGGASGVGTIIDDDAAPTISSVTSASATEATSIVHTVNLSNASSSATTFTLTLADVTATGGGTDYTSALTSTAFTNGVTIAGGVITVPAGVTTFSVSVATTTDTIDEANETYNLTVGGASGVGTILDDDAAPTVSSVSSVSATEATSIVHTVNLSNPSSSVTTFTFTFGGGTATGGGTDYTSTLTSTAFTNGVTISGGVITVPAGVTTFSVSVPTTSDTIDEPNETYNLTIGGASGVGTIIDDDAAPTISSVTSASATEATSIVHTVNLSNASSSVTTFTLTLADVTATGGGTDYTSALTSTAFTNGVTIAGGVITVPAGVTTFSVSVATTTDTIDEPNETYNLTVGGASGVGTILDDDAAPTISSVGSVSATEATSIVHTVNLSNPSSSVTTFTFTFGGGTATGGGTDYTSTLTSTAFTNGVTISGGVITVPAGVTTFSVSVPTTSDTIDEPNETYNLTIGGASGVGTIIDDDPTPTISSVSSVSATEATSIVHTVNLSNPASSVTTFALALGDVTATGGGTDYTSALTSTAFTNGVTISGGVITVPAGVTTFSVSVPTTSDTIDEPNETYNLTVGGASGVGTIIDDDNAPTVSTVSNDTQIEGTSLVQTVTLTNSSSSVTTFTYALGGGTATSGSDYSTAVTFSNGVTLSGGVVTVPANVSSFTVTVPTVNDTTPESTETVTLTVGGISGTGTIIDNEPDIDLDLNNSSAATGRDFNNSYTENGAAVTIGDVDTRITDADSVNIVSATITLTNRQALDVLTAGSLPGGIVASAYDSVTGILTLSGTTTLANYETAIRTITFSNTGDNPGSVTRVVTVTVNDGTADSAVATANITVTPVNDPPVTSNVVANGNEDQPAPIAIPLVGTDVDGTVASFTVSSLPTNGTLFYIDAGFETPVVIGSPIPSTGNLTLYFRPLPDSFGTTGFNFITTDNNGANSASATATINVASVDDGLPAAVADSFNVVLGTPITFSKASLLANDTLPDHAAFFSFTTATPNGALVDNGDGTMTFTPSVTGTPTFTYTVKDDQGSTSTATVTFNVGTASDDLATVYESALPAGSGGGNLTASGFLLANDGGAGTQVSRITLNGGGTWITDGGAGDTDPTAGVIRAATTYGTVSVTAATGAYTYTLNTRADNSLPANNAAITDTIGYGYSTNSIAANLRVSIRDDVPAAADATVVIPASPSQAYTIYIVLDVSGSMSGTSGAVRNTDANGVVTITDRITIAKQALIALVTQYFAQSSDVIVKFETFQATASFVGTYTNLSAATTGINSATAGGGTNYEAALNAAQDNFGVVDSTRNNFIYFLSDGTPSVGNTVDPATAVYAGTGRSFATFANGAYVGGSFINSYAVGIGTGISSLTQLNAINNTDQLKDGNPDPAIIVPDLTQLDDQLLSTVPVTFGGNVVAGGSGTFATFGADTGYVKTMTLTLDTNNNGVIDAGDVPVTFTFTPGGTPATDSITASSAVPGLPLNGTHTLTLNLSRQFVYGTLVFDFSTGDYSYFSGNSANAGSSFSLTSVVTDLDGDTASSTQTITVVDGKPFARDDSDTLFAGTTFLEGNVVSGSGTDSGLANGTAFSPFASAGAGVDTIVDNAKVTAINFHGSSVSLIAATGSTALFGGTYTVAYNAGTGFGSFVWTKADGSALTFDTTGYYKYTPPTANIPVTPAGAGTATAVSTALTAAPGFGTGVDVMGVTAAGAPTTVNYNATSGVGVQGGGNNANVNNDENLLITFPKYSSVQSINVNAANSNLGGANTLTYSFYNYNTLLGTFTSNAEGVVAMPGAISALTNVTRVDINADGTSSARIQGINYTLTSTAQTYLDLQAAPGGATGVTLSGMSRTSSVPDTTATFAANVGAAVTGGGSNATIDNLESLVITFAQTTFALGVQNVVVNVSPTSNLGPPGGGTDPSLTYKMYGVDGAFLGQFSSDKEGAVAIPTTYNGIGKIVIEAAGDATASIQGIAYDTVANPAATSIAPETVGYTLTDAQNSQSSATLTLNIVSQNYYGTAAGDTITGGTANDHIVGVAGADSLSGGAGYDILDGGDGNDTLDGGNDDDTLAGGNGNDSMRGGAGNDVMRGDAGNDTLDGGTGNNWLDGGAGNDSLLGNTGADTLTGGAGNDIMDGAAGVDTFRFLLADKGSTGAPNVDTINNFATGPTGDVLDLRDLLAGESTSFGLTGNLTYFLHFEKVGADTKIHISSGGGFSAGYQFSKEDETIIVTGVDMVTGFASDQAIIQNLLANNKLVTD